jgi:hypothetical protein
MDAELVLAATIPPHVAGAWPDEAPLSPLLCAQLAEVLRLFEPTWSAPSDEVPEPLRALSECPIECWDVRIGGAPTYRLWLAVDGGWFFAADDPAQRIEALYVSAYSLYDERDMDDGLASALERARVRAAAAHPESVLSSMSFEPEEG